MSDPLRGELIAGDVRLVPFDDAHVEPLRLACAEDSEIWEIYPHSLVGEHFAPSLAKRRAAPGVLFAACLAQELVGMTAYLRPDPDNGVVEIGGTFIAPRVRGGPFNRAMKKLMIEHAFANGYHRISFMVDERNKRSQAAVLKLGASYEGTLRRDRITWTGHLRNTCVFSLLREEWHG